MNGMNAVVIEPTTNSIKLEEVETHLDADLVDVYSTYHFLHPAQVVAEHREVRSNADD